MHMQFVTLRSLDSLIQRKYIAKLNFSQCLDTIAMEILFPKIWIDKILLKSF